MSSPACQPKPPRRNGRPPKPWNDVELRADWAAGLTYDRIAAKHHKNKRDITKRCRELGLRDRRLTVQAATSHRTRPPETRPPAPAGDPITWGAISSEPWPGLNR